MSRRPRRRPWKPPGPVATRIGKMLPKGSLPYRLGLSTYETCRRGWARFLNKTIYR